jgi:hypothetical protein
MKANDGLRGILLIGVILCRIFDYFLARWRVLASSMSPGENPKKHDCSEGVKRLSHDDLPADFGLSIVA